MLYTAHRTRCIRQEFSAEALRSDCGATPSEGNQEAGSMTGAREPFVHPYIPNAVPAIKQAMLTEVGAASIDEFYADVPESIRLRRPLDLPTPMRSEAALARHVGGLLRRNVSTRENLSFLGSGVYQHHVPAVVDEVVNRS